MLENIIRISTIYICKQQTTNKHANKTHMPAQQKQINNTERKTTILRFPYICSFIYKTTNARYVHKNHTKQVEIRGGIFKCTAQYTGRLRLTNKRAAMVINGNFLAPHLRVYMRPPKHHPPLATSTRATNVKHSNCANSLIVVGI